MLAIWLMFRLPASFWLPKCQMRWVDIYCKSLKSIKLKQNLKLLFLPQLGFKPSGCVLNLLPTFCRQDTSLAASLCCPVSHVSIACGGPHQGGQEEESTTRAGLLSLLSSHTLQKAWHLLGWGIQVLTLANAPAHMARANTYLYIFICLYLLVSSDM